MRPITGDLELALDENDALLLVRSTSTTESSIKSPIKAMASAECECAHPDRFRFAHFSRTACR